VRPRFTNRALRYRGPTKIVTARLHPDLAKYLDAQVGRERGLRSLSYIIQDACGLWAMLDEREQEVKLNGQPVGEDLPRGAVDPG